MNYATKHPLSLGIYLSLIIGTFSLTGCGGDDTPPGPVISSELTEPLKPEPPPVISPSDPKAPPVSVRPLTPGKISDLIGPDPANPIVRPVKPGSLDVGPADSLNVKTFGATGDGNTDDATAIAAAVEVAAAQKKPLYFPVGVYRITNSINLRNGSTLIGSEVGLSLLKADSENHLRLGAPEWSSPRASNVTIRNMAFVDIEVRFWGNLRNITVERNIFFGDSPTEEAQLSIGAKTSNSVVRENIFLRNQYGRGVSLWQAQDTRVEGNLFGLPDGQAARTRLSPQLPNQLLYLINKSQSKIDNYPSNATLGCFKTGINLLSDNINSQIIDNIFIGNRDEENCTKDHVIYAKTSKKLRIIGNFFHGWLNDAGGGVKFKNGEDIVVAANMFDDTSLLLHVFPGLSFTYLKDFYVIGNYYRGITNYDDSQAGFSTRVYRDETPWSSIHSTVKSDGLYNVVFAYNRLDVNDARGAKILFQNAKLDSVFSYKNIDQNNLPVRLLSNFGLVPINEPPILPNDCAESQYNCTKNPPHYLLTEDVR